MKIYIEKDKEKRIHNINKLKDIIKNEGIKLEGAKNFIENKVKESNYYDLSSITFSDDNVINSIEEKENPAVLIFASAKNPGGGVLNGSIAQEEIISSHTTWYFQAKENNEFYVKKGESALNTDNVSIAKGYLITNQYNYEIEPKPVNFIACAAPNLKGIMDQKLKILDDMIYNHLNIRIRKILIAAEESGSKSLILGAFGCGVFGLDSSRVANCFKKNIELGLYTGQIEFTIISKDILDIFKKVFNNEINLEINNSEIKKKKSKI